MLGAQLALSLVSRWPSEPSPMAVLPDWAESLQPATWALEWQQYCGCSICTTPAAVFALVLPPALVPLFTPVRSILVFASLPCFRSWLWSRPLVWLLDLDFGFALSSVPDSWIYACHYSKLPLQPPDELVGHPCTKGLHPDPDIPCVWSLNHPIGIKKQNLFHSS